MKQILKPILLGVTVGAVIPILFGPYGGCAIMAATAVVLMLP